MRHHLLWFCVWCFVKIISVYEYKRTFINNFIYWHIFADALFFNILKILLFLMKQNIIVYEKNFAFNRILYFVRA